MIMPSLLTWVIGAAVLVIASFLLRFLANDAHELARERGRALFAPGHKSSSRYRKAA